MLVRDWLLWWARVNRVRYRLPAAHPVASPQHDVQAARFPRAREKRKAKKFLRRTKPPWKESAGIQPRRWHPGCAWARRAIAQWACGAMPAPGSGAAWCRKKAYALADPARLQYEISRLVPRYAAALRPGS